MPHHRSAGGQPSTSSSTAGPSTSALINFASSSSAIPMIPQNVSPSEMHLYLLLFHANLADYFSTFIRNGEFSVTFSMGCVMRLLAARSDETHLMCHEPALKHYDRTDEGHVLSGKWQ